MTRDEIDAPCPCDRRRFLHGVAALVVMSGPLATVAACQSKPAPAGDSGGWWLDGQDTGSSGQDTGSSGSCDGSHELCIDLADPNNAAILGTVGSAGYVSIDSDILIIIHHAQDEYIVLSAICTHQGCEVSYDKRADDLPCYCHGSIFALDGSVIQSPARRPLKVYETSLDGDTLIIVID